MRLETPGSVYSDNYPNRFLEETFGEAAATAMRRAEQETLIEADTTARVPIPIMNFELFEAPWSIFVNSQSAKCFTNLQTLENKTCLLSMQKSYITTIIGSKSTKWPVLKVYRNNLKWNPFPLDLAKVAMEEKYIENDGIWKAFVFGPEADDIVDTSSLTWTPGLKILQGDDDDDDEIEPGQFPKNNTKNLAFLAKKRKRDIDGQKEIGARRSLSGLSKAYKSGEIVATSALRLSGKGQEMLEKMGWTADTALGSFGTGILDPVEAAMRPKRLGLKTVDEVPKNIKFIVKRKLGEQQDEPKGNTKKILTSPNNRPIGIKTSKEIKFVSAGENSLQPTEEETSVDCDDDDFGVSPGIGDTTLDPNTALSCCY